MEPIQFKVRGLPPKKHRKNGSMWRTDAEKLRALRNAALEVIEALVQPDCIKGEPYFQEREKIRLTLCVHVESQKEAESGETGSGDLDNFVSGVCDGLMKAHGNALVWINQDERFKKWWPNNSIHPSRAIAYKDDSQIMEICAKKVVNPALGDACWYKVKLEELAS